jgi:hypothetical protein
LCYHLQHSTLTLISTTSTATLSTTTHPELLRALPGQPAEARQLAAVLEEVHDRRIVDVVRQIAGEQLAAALRLLGFLPAGRLVARSATVPVMFPRYT